MSYSTSVFPAVAILSSILVLIPLPWHLQAWNTGTCMYMIWCSLACFNLGINSAIWSSDAINRLPTWCDISSRIVVASAVALPASSLCILRRLHKIISAQTLNSSSASRKKEATIDLLIGVGLPVLQIAMQYIVSGHRYDIYEEVGCWPYTYNTAVAYPLSIIWPIVIGLVSIVYSICILSGLIRRRAQLSEFLSSTASLTAHRYLRLMAIALMEMLCTVPVASYGMYLNLTTHAVRPWISWSDTHYGYSKVDRYPSLLWRADHLMETAIELSRWLPIVCALLFFMFFGFAEEARKHYRQAVEAVASFLHLRRKTVQLPLYTKRYERRSILARRPRARVTSFSLSITSIVADQAKDSSLDGSIYDSDAVSTSETLTCLPSPSSTSALISFPEKAHI